MKTPEQIETAKRVPIVAYLAALGYEPVNSNSTEFCYFSPLRVERTPSFYVNTKTNLWNDKGNGEGDSTIGLVMKYKNVGFAAAVDELLTFADNPPAKVSKYILHPEKQRRLELLNVAPLTSEHLLQYAAGRGISPRVAAGICKEITYRVIDTERIYKAIGFKNDGGGYELRYRGRGENAVNFKGCLGAKELTTITRNKNSIVNVFEGFFSFLSYIEYKQSRYENTFIFDFVILNSLSMLKRFDPTKYAYARVNLFLDNDESGRAAAEKLIKQYPQLCITNQSALLFPNLKDFNDFLLCQNAANPQTGQKSKIG